MWRWMRWSGSRVRVRRDRREFPGVRLVRIWGMPPTPLGPAPLRPAAVVNEAIRALWLRAAGRRLTVAEREYYELLLVEWAAAMRASVDVAA